MSEELTDLLPETMRALRRRWSQLLAPWELSPHQSRALRVIASLESPRLSAVASRLRIAPRSATEVVDALEQRGLVVRTPDPQDRRAVCLATTSEGEQVVREIDRARASDAEEFFGVLSGAERDHLARLLAKIVEPR